MESKKCEGCGMTMDEASDFAMKNTESIYCRYCVDENGEYAEYGELLKTMTKRNVFSMGVDIDIAEKIARQNLSNDRKLTDVGDVNIFGMHM